MKTLTIVLAAITLAACSSKQLLVDTDAVTLTDQETNAIKSTVARVVKEPVEFETMSAVRNPENGAIAVCGWINTKGPSTAPGRRPFIGGLSGVLFDPVYVASDAKQTSYVLEQCARLHADM